FQVINSYEAKIKEIFDEDADTLYIPAARSIISTIALENSYDLLKNDKFDYTVKNFISAMDAFKKLRWSNNPLKTLKIYLDNYDISKFNNEIKIKKYENIVQDILKGHYLLEKDKEFIIINNQKIEFQFASSGQQEVLWILNFLILSIINERKFFFVIEEPEAHLFTQTQLDVTKFIAMTANLTNSEIFITTHSPYILNAVNLLMYSGKVEKESINANSIIDILYRIDPKKVGAFYIKGGKLIDIIDPDEMLIQSEKIDEVAGGINLLFDKLISLELNKQNGENNGL
ncbi:MAG TPA: ATP-binding protein, partial [Candidatus Fusicatenibacter intestinipullorum]|nr:ATP-binding protein [Candidatus Fusicatenibacter intestinipullorum]